MDKKNKKFSQSFLDKIMQMESGGGKFQNHQPADPKSMHLGTTAIGRYGLMPLTISDVINQSQNPEFKDLKQFTDFSTVGNPEVSLQKQEALKQYIKSNPMIEDMIAKEIQNKIESNVGGDEKLGAVAWHAGSDASDQLIKKFLKEKGKRGTDARTYMKRWNKLGNTPESVPTLQQESVSYTGPSLLGLMSQRPTVEDMMDAQAQQEIDSGLWSKLKEYLSNYYKGPDEE